MVRYKSQDYFTSIDMVVYTGLFKTKYERLITCSCSSSQIWYPAGIPPQP